PRRKDATHEFQAFEALERWLADVASTGVPAGDWAVGRQGTSSFFDPCLLLGNQALHELRALFLAGLNTFVEKHLTNLRQRPQPRLLGAHARDCHRRAHESR